jgi:hypothetical protein
MVVSLAQTKRFVFLLVVGLFSVVMLESVAFSRSSLAPVSGLPAGVIRSAAEARQKATHGSLRNSSHLETGGRPGHATSGHGYSSVNDPKILDERNNPDKIYISTKPTNPVVIFWKDGDVVITEMADTLSVRTAYG